MSLGTGTQGARTISKALMDCLNDILAGDLTAVDLYMYQSKIMERFGYSKLASHFLHERDHEMQHVDMILKRMIFLGGSPDMSVRKPYPLLTQVPEMLDLDLKFEVEMAGKIKEAIKLCWDEQDHVTRGILETMLVDTEEDHIDWIEKQQTMINDIGLKNYLAKQI
jgi:bacterioferritin